MTQRELSDILARMYGDAPWGEATTAIRLFGIKYADDIKNFSVREIVEDSGLSTKYVTEVNKGIKLAPHVRVLEQ